MKKGTATTTVTTTTKTTSLPPAQGKVFNAAHYVRPGLSEAQVLQIKTGFDLFDTDHGGTIDLNQFKAAMVSLSFDAKNAVIFQMLSDLDEDGNKQIDFEQWVHLMTHRVSHGSSKESITKIFPLYDDEKTEHISVKNLRRVANDLGEDITDEQLEEMIKRADVIDQDGLVSLQEFYTILTRKIKD